MFEIKCRNAVGRAGRGSREASLMPFRITQATGHKDRGGAANAEEKPVQTVLRGNRWTKADRWGVQTSLQIFGNFPKLLNERHAQEGTKHPTRCKFLARPCSTRRHLCLFHSQVTSDRQETRAVGLAGGSPGLPNGTASLIDQAEQPGTTRRFTDIHRVNRPLSGGLMLIHNRRFFRPLFPTGSIGRR
ncbi:hypothetical protein Pan14r_02270 [Crateriforma conspicua]|uniref:Uncharacterized protein n=1 Tax=Crateriforma conspicua TaxID=2527996 RepID=A0A5C5XZK7_9PLAN|nr:hypothetical protein Pan14r_02270 [Crateriforma conspicua]